MSYCLRVSAMSLALAGWLGLAPFASAQSQQQQPATGVSPLPTPQPDTGRAAQTPQSSPVASAGGGVQNACRDELKNFCSNVTPGEGRLLLCMQAHADKLGDQCEFALFDASRHVEQAMHRIERLAAACWTDIQTNCSGRGAIGQCIQEHSASLSAPCRDAVAALQQAKSDPSATGEPPRRAWAGLPVYSADGMRLGQVTDVRVGADGLVQMIQAELGGMLGIGSSTVLISPDEFEQMADRVQLRMGSDQVRSILQQQR